MRIHTHPAVADNGFRTIVRCFIAQIRILYLNLTINAPDTPESPTACGTGMKQRKNIRHFLLFFDLVILALCIAGVEQSRQKAGLGADIDTFAARDGFPSMLIHFVRSDSSTLKDGDTLLSIGDYSIRNPVDVEQIVDQFSIGTVERVTVRRDGSTRTERVTLVPYYSTLDVVVQAAAIAVFFFLALFVVAQRPRDPAALQFHHLVVIVACVMAFTMGRYTMEPHGLGHFLRALFPLSNAFVGSLLLHFSLVFPHSGKLSFRATAALHFLPAAVAVWGCIASYQATMPFDLSAAPSYYSAMTAGKGLLGIGAVASIGVFVTRFIHEHDSGYRRQIAWAMTGTIISTVAYVFWQLSTSGNVQAYLPSSVIRIFEAVHMNEIVLNAALLVTASFMVIGIIRYRIFNIEVLLKRGTVYALVLTILILVYAGFLAFAVRLIGARSETAHFSISIAALVFDLILFMPTRGLVQRMIDRTFFRVDYNFRKALRTISERVLAGVQPEDVARVMISGLDSLLHLHGIMVMEVQGEDQLLVLDRQGFPRWRYAGLHIHPDRLRKLPIQPLVFGSSIEPEMDVVRSDMGFARRYEIAMIYAIRAEDGTVVGLLVIGHKKSSLRFTLEDIDLIRSVTLQAGLQFERLQLQQRLLRQRHEAERLRELNRMKSYFVSGVSHDLKTPLTSISMFAELLEDQMPDERGEARRSIEIIRGECGRLARLINNVLDFTRLERGTLQYSMTGSDLNRITERAFENMEYQMGIGGFTCSLELHPEPLPVLADADAILEALTNLLSNAMKYSGIRRDIALRTSRDGRHCSVEVTDHGLGIRDEEIPHLFEPYYRSRDDIVQKLGGVGLGLSLVKHIVDAHHGQITVESAHGAGSTFRFNFDLLEAS